VGRTERNTAEIEALYRQHGAALLLFATAISGDRGRAQDAVHQVFLKAIENGSVSQAINKKAYLFACVRNAVLNDAKVQDRNMRLNVNSAWFSPPVRIMSSWIYELWVSFQRFAPQALRAHRACRFFICRTTRVTVQTAPTRVITLRASTSAQTPTPPSYLTFQEHVQSRFDGSTII